MSEEPILRRGVPEDALALGVLAMQVFLDTYATRGVNGDLAREATAACSPTVFASRLADSRVEIIVAEHHGYLTGFVDLDARTQCPVAGVSGLEVFRLYVQAPFRRRGLGGRLLGVAEQRAGRAEGRCVWLTAYSGNTSALRFYEKLGYRDVGATDYVFEGNAYENRVLVKRATPGIG